MKQLCKAPLVKNGSLLDRPSTYHFSKLENVPAALHPFLHCLPFAPYLLEFRIEQHLKGHMVQCFNARKNHAKGVLVLKGVKKKNRKRKERPM